MNSNVCCFTGHRNIPKIEMMYIKAQVAMKIDELSDIGVNTFICGGAVGFDALCETEVLKLRERKKNIKLIVAVPCADQSRYYSSPDRKIYDEVLKRADDVIYVSNGEYTRGCMQKRNKYMVDNSAYIISYCKKSYGGTFFTRSYAKNNGLSIIDVGI